MKPFASLLQKPLKVLSPGLQRLARYIVQYKVSIVLALIAMIGAGAASSLIAVLLGKLTDIGFYQQEPWIIIAAPVGLIFISALNGGSMLASSYLLASIDRKSVV